MSILIRGMDKPTDCGLCLFEDFGYCSVKGERNTSESGIDDDCPLIAIKDLTEEEVDSILARMMMADRKTENSSEKPNNCEECKHWNDTKDGCADRHECRATTEDWQDWKDKMWAEAIVTEPTTEDCSTVPTSSKMEQVDEPQTERSE